MAEAEQAPEPTAMILALQRLNGLGFPTQTWDITTTGMQERQFFSLLEKVISLDDRTLMEAILIGTSDGQWTTVGTCSIVQMTKFCKWIKSPDGKPFRNIAKCKRDIEKKRVDGYTIEQTVFACALLDQKKEYKKYETKTMKDEQDKTEAGKKLVKVEQEMQPGSVYVEPNIAEIGTICLQLHAEREGTPNPNPEECRRRYGNEAKNIHVMQFLTYQREKQLRRWIVKKIHSLAKFGNSHKLNNFCAYATFLREDDEAFTPDIMKVLMTSMLKKNPSP